MRFRHLHLHNLNKIDLKDEKILSKEEDFEEVWIPESYLLTHTSPDDLNVEDDLLYIVLIDQAFLRIEALEDTLSKMGTLLIKYQEILSEAIDELNRKSED